MECVEWGPSNTLFFYTISITLSCIYIHVIFFISYMLLLCYGICDVTVSFAIYQNVQNRSVYLLISSMFCKTVLIQ